MPKQETRDEAVVSAINRIHETITQEVLPLVERMAEMQCCAESTLKQKGEAGMAPLVFLTDLARVREMVNSVWDSLGESSRQMILECKGTLDENDRKAEASRQQELSR